MTDHFDRKDVPGSDVRGDPDVGVTVTVTRAATQRSRSTSASWLGARLEAGPCEHRRRSGQAEGSDLDSHLTDPSRAGLHPAARRPGRRDR
jgi:hypothetical protein